MLTSQPQLKDFNKLFLQLSLEDQNFVLNFIAFLLEKTEPNLEIEKELLERKLEGLKDFEQGKTIPEEKVYEEIEAIIRK